jgi:uncharacterized SAM-binding protein YcdF (DUF218 family)
VFYVLSKTLDLFLSPLTWALVLAGFGVWGVRTNRRRVAIVLPIAAIATLLVFSAQPVSNALVRSLEADASTTMKPDVTYDVVVVLGGIATVNAREVMDLPEFNDAVDRLVAAHELLRRDRARTILVTSEAAESHALARVLEQWGIAKERILVEDQSRNTRENAVRTAAILNERGLSRVLLVTSAAHMPRAAGCFRAAGVTFDTLSVDRRAIDASFASFSPLPRAEALAVSTNAIREWCGRIVYRVMGYSK